MNIFIIGSGTFGTAIANELARNKDNEVIIFSRSEIKKKEINNFQTNEKYFPGKKLNDSLICTNQYSDVQNAAIVFIALPSLSIVENLKLFSPYISNKQVIVNLSKGILTNGHTIIEFLQKELISNNIITLKGPSFAVEIMKRANTLMTLGYSNEKHKKLIFEIFRNSCIHLESTKDIYGVEMLGIIKNMYAILFGIIEEQFSSPNTRFMILSKMFNEIKILNNKFNIDDETLFLSCGLGDLCLTSFNDVSRNKTLGKKIGKGHYTLKEKNNFIVEGVYSVKTIISLIDSTTLEKLPLLKKLFLFFDSKCNKFEINLNQLD